MDRQTEGHFRDSIGNIATMGSERSTGREHRCRVLLEVVSTRIGSPSLLENRLPHYGLRSPVSQPSIALAYAVMSPPSSQNCQALDFCHLDETFELALFPTTLRGTRITLNLFARY